MQLSDRIGRRLKLHDLHVLMGVMQAGSMSRAAALLNTTQSAISRSIADLELTVGVRLLDRGPHGVEPTQYGRALLKRGAIAIDELKQGIRDIEFLSDPEAGELRIGASGSLMDGVVAAIIDRVSRRHPRIFFQIVLASAPAQYQELRERRIELGFAGIAGPAQDQDIDQELLFEGPIVVVAGANNPWTRRRKIDLAELVNEPWTWPSPGTTFDSLIVAAFRARGLEPPRATVSSDAPRMRVQLAASGRFLAAIPSHVLRFPAKHSSIKLLPVELSTTQQQIGIITLKNRTLSPLAQLLIDCARELAKPVARGQALGGRAKAISSRKFQT
jgi:DNA-binding transcriptional LysR family regulator